MSQREYIRKTQTTDSASQSIEVVFFLPFLIDFLVLFPWSDKTGNKVIVSSNPSFVNTVIHCVVNNNPMSENILTS